jgi:hypothetical protein
MAESGESRAFATKAIPPAKSVRDLLRLRPPQVPGIDHNYFADAERVEFRPDAPALSLGLAWWLAEMSLLAYVRDPHAIASQLSRAGFGHVRCFGFEKRRSTECFAARSDDALVVAFRGTEARERVDWATNLRARLVPFDAGGSVHGGFLRALEHEETWRQLERHIREHQGKRRLVFTGHSLGGALASLAAARHPNSRLLYTFGAPKVGDRDFARNTARDHQRIVNGRDLVPRLPPFPRYAHSGALHDLGARGSLGAIVDHMPLIYALRVWNAFVGEKGGRDGVG